MIEPDDEPRPGPSRTERGGGGGGGGGARPRSRRGWFRTGRAARAANAEGGSTSADAELDGNEQRAMPLAALDAALPDMDESDWAYALRWSQPSDQMRVYAQIQRAQQSEDPRTLPGHASDGTAYEQQRRGAGGAAGHTSSFGDASALAAAARRAVRMVVPDASAGEAGGGESSARTPRPARGFHRRSAST